MTTNFYNRSFLYAEGQIHFYETPSTPPQILQVAVKEHLDWWDSFLNRVYKEITFPRAGSTSIMKSVYVDVSGTDFEKVAEDNPVDSNLLILMKCTIPSSLLTPLTPVISKEYIVVDAPPEAQDTTLDHVVVPSPLELIAFENISTKTVITADPSVYQEVDGFVLVDSFKLIEKP